MKTLELFMLEKIIVALHVILVFFFCGYLKGYREEMEKQYYTIDQPEIIYIKDVELPVDHYLKAIKKVESSDGKFKHAVLEKKYLKKFKDKKLASSHGSYQIMGFHAKRFNVKIEDLYNDKVAHEVAKRILLENYERLGSWDKAIKAYNGSGAQADKYLQKVYAQL